MPSFTAYTDAAETTADLVDGVSRVDDVRCPHDRACGVAVVRRQ